MTGKKELDKRLEERLKLKLKENPRRLMTPGDLKEAEEWYNTISKQKIYSKASSVIIGKAFLLIKIFIECNININLTA